MGLRLFNPPPDAIDSILDDLTDPARSYNEVAQRARTTTAALSCWFMRDDIQERFRAIDAAVAIRTRHIAAAQLPAAACAAGRIIANFNRTPTAPTPDAADPAIECRRNANALRASSLLMRFARLSLDPPTRRAPRPRDGQPAPPRPGSAPRSEPRAEATPSRTNADPVRQSPDTSAAPTHVAPRTAADGLLARTSNTSRLAGAAGLVSGP